MNRYIFPFVILFFTLFSVSFAQEFDCEITLNVDPLTAEARENLSDFVQQLKQYINNYHWTKEDFGEDKIKCSFDIFIQGSPQDNHYVAQASIVSQRPVRKLNKNTAVVRIKDDKWEFDYVRFQPLNHDDFRFDPLISFFDYYAYLILGFDFDTFNPAAGTPYFQKALDVVNKGRGSINGGKGWEISSQNTYTRGTLVDELLNPKYRDLREAVFKYHVRGLDLLRSKPDKGKQNLLNALESIGKLQEKINQRSLAIKVFFDAKYMEIAETFTDYVDPTVYEKLSKIDQAHQKTYEEYRDKRRK